MKKIICVLFILILTSFSFINDKHIILSEPDIIISIKVHGINEDNIILYSSNLSIKENNNSQYIGIIMKDICENGIENVTVVKDTIVKDTMDIKKTNLLKI